MANLQDTFGGGSSEETETSTSDSERDRRIDEADAPEAVKRAVKQTPDAAPSARDAPEAVKRAVEQTPDAAPSQPDKERTSDSSKSSGRSDGGLSAGGIGQGYSAPRDTSGISAGGAGQGYNTGDYRTRGRSVEKNENLLERFTSGGFISEETEDDLRRRSRNFTRTAGDYIDRSSDYNPAIFAERKVIDVGQSAGFDFGGLVKDGEGVTERVTEGVAKGAASAVDPFGIALGVEAGAEVADDVPNVVASGQTGDAIETGLAVGDDVTAAGVDAFADDPIGFTSKAAGAIGTGFVLGGGSSVVARETGLGTKLGGVKRRVTGSTKIDSPVGEDVRRFYEDGDPSGSQFPRFDTRDGESLEDTFRRQADENTPDEIKTALGDRKADETYASHMTQYDFESEFDAGITKTREADPTNTMFFAPESNVYFAGFGKGGGYSLRPRIPRLRDFTGDKRSDIRTRIKLGEEPDTVRSERLTQDPATSPDDFIVRDNGARVKTTKGDESKFLESEEPGQLFVRSPENRNLGEAEGVVSTGTKFREVTGKDSMYYEFANKNVDVRLFEPVGSDELMDLQRRVAAGERVDYSPGDLYDSGDLSDLYRGTDAPEGTPYVPPVGTSSGGGGYSTDIGGGSSSGGGSGSSRGSDSIGDFFSSGGPGSSSSGGSTTTGGSGGSGGSGGPPIIPGGSGGPSGDSFGSPGSSGGGGIPALGGGYSGPAPGLPVETAPNRPRDLDLGSEKQPKKKRDEDPFGFATSQVYTDFRNPLTGKRLETGRGL